jgi:hypothetical protein
VIEGVLSVEGCSFLEKNRTVARIKAIGVTTVVTNITFDFICRNLGVESAFSTRKDVCGIAETVGGLTF